MDLEEIHQGIEGLLSSLPRVKVTPETISQPLIDGWYKREARYREQINSLCAHLDTDHAVMVQLGLIADHAVKMLEHVNMDTDEDRELHARAVGALRGRLDEIAAGMKEANEGAKRQPVKPLPEGFASSNAYRSRQAGQRDAELARRALEVVGAQCSQRMRAVAEARIADPEASWSEVAAKLGLTRDQAASLFQRLKHRLHVAQLRENGSRDH